MISKHTNKPLAVICTDTKTNKDELYPSLRNCANHFNTSASHIRYYAAGGSLYKGRYRFRLKR